MSFNRLTLITILITFLNYNAQANKDTKVRKLYASPDHVQNRHHSRLGIILISPKQMLKYPNDIAKLLHTSSESDSREQNQEALRQRAQSSDSEQYNSTEMEKIVFLPNNTHKYIRTAEVVDSTNEDINDGMTGPSLRDKEELKCIDACKEVVGNVCGARSCGYKERHVFEKECFSACESRFRK